MRVVCIDASKPPNMPLAPLVEGERYTVARTQMTWEGYDSYILVETMQWQESNKIAFVKERFIPASSIDETQMERNYDKIKELT